MKSCRMKLCSPSIQRISTRRFFAFGNLQQCLPPSQKDVREVFGFNRFDVIFLIIMLLKHSAI